MVIFIQDCVLYKNYSFAGSRIRIHCVAGFEPLSIENTNLPCRLEPTRPNVMQPQMALLRRVEEGRIQSKGSPCSTRRAGHTFLRFHLLLCGCYTAEVIPHSLKQTALKRRSGCGDGSCEYHKQAGAVQLELFIQHMDRASALSASH